jgi:tetratricopeptide (TPR) repeat protein
MALLLAVVSDAMAQKKPKSTAAIDSLERRASADSNDAAVLFQLGRALLEQGRHDEAERRFRQAVQVAPGYAEAYLALAAVPQSRGDEYWKQREKRDGQGRVESTWLEAAKFYRLAFLLDPLVDPGLIPRADERVTLSVDGMNYRVWWVFPLAKAINAFRAGKYEDAERRCDKLVEESEGGLEGTDLPGAVLWFHALSAAHLDDFNQAATDFTILMNRAVREAQSTPLQAMPLLTNDYRYMAAIMHYSIGHGQIASLLFREALTVDPSLYMAHSDLARMLEEAGAWNEAVLERQRAVDVNPENSELLTDLGVTLTRAGKPEAALAAFDQGAQMNPRDPKVAYHAAVTALQLGRKDVARSSLERFLKIAPSRMASEMSEARRHLAALGQ